MLKFFSAYIKIISLNLGILNLELKKRKLNLFWSTKIKEIKNIDEKKEIRIIPYLVEFLFELLIPFF